MIAGQIDNPYFILCRSILPGSAQTAETRMKNNLFFLLTTIFFSGLTQVFPFPATLDTIPEYSMNEIIILVILVHLLKKYQYSKLMQKQSGER